MIAAVSCLRAGHPVVYIDSEGFSIERFRQIAGEDTEKLAEHLFLFEPLDFEHQGTMIAEAEKVLKAHKPGLLVMDSATALYRTDLEKGRDALQALTKQMIHLLGYCKRYEIPVIITNQVYMDTVKNTFYGLGGVALEHLSKVIIRLEKTDTPGRPPGPAGQAPLPPGRGHVLFRDRGRGCAGKGLTGPVMACKPLVLPGHFIHLPGYLPGYCNHYILRNLKGRCSWC